MGVREEKEWWESQASDLRPRGAEPGSAGRRASPTPLACPLTGESGPGSSGCRFQTACFFFSRLLPPGLKQRLCLRAVLL